MAPTIFSRYWAGSGTIQKVTARPDGSIEVEGVASTPDRDLSGEIVTAEAMRTALPPFLLGFPALRVMHQPVAAGKVTFGEVRRDGSTWVRAMVIDRDTIEKVKAGVLPAFSIGGKCLRRDPDDPSIITALRLTELSLVDSPANSAATIESVKAALAKADGATRGARVGSGAPPPNREGRGSPPEPAPAMAVPYDPRPSPAPDAPDTSTGPGPKRSVYDGRCVGCGGPLPATCPKCATPKQAPASAEADKVLKLSRSLALARSDVEAAIGMMKSERQQAARKLAVVERGAQGLAKRLDRAEALTREAVAERDEANRLLRDRPKGALRGVPGRAVSKGADLGNLTGRDFDPEVEPDAHSLIRAAHRNPRVL